MSRPSRRAALVGVMLNLPAAASALTCAEEADRAGMLAREASAIVIARVTHVAGDAPAAPASMLAAFTAPPTEREIEIEPTEVMKGEVPDGAFRARFLEGPCAHLPADGKRRIIYLVQEHDGWRVLGSN